MWPRLRIDLLAFLLLCVLLWVAVGCTRDPYGLGKTAPVRGIVRLGDVPLHNGIITFHPNASKGNTSPHQPSAPIGADGTYELFTVGKGEAPLGWYTVTISAYETDSDRAKRAKSPGEAGLQIKSLVNKKYEEPGTTPLAVEVVEDASPGTYDFKVTP
jgi:hypothetical protein